jgi:DNA-binding transcriptional MerR regulator
VKVSELAERAGIAPSAIRWSDSVGVLPQATRQPNGYREYVDEDLALLRIVVSLPVLRAPRSPVEIAVLRACAGRGSGIE